MLFVMTMARLSLLLGLSACVALSSAAQAQEQKPAKAAEPKQATQTGTENRPFMDAISKGDRAAVARDFEAAIAAYREAIQKAPQNALGHYRIGSAQLLKGDQKEAEAAFVTGLRFVGKDGTLKGKLLFALADLRERQKNNDEAIGRWKEYSANTEAQKEAITYPATATERVTRNEGWKKLQAESAEVKARIEKRLKEADEASRKSAADPKNK
jgi:tetratricopeptide (TPR) repeat protein